MAYFSCTECPYATNSPKQAALHPHPMIDEGDDEVEA